MFVKKQPTPICVPWKELSQPADLYKNNPVHLPMKTETSKQPQLSDIGVLNKEFSDIKIKGNTYTFKPIQMTKKTGSLKEHRLFGPRNQAQTKLNL
jgi:hypothetical protein